MESNQIWKIDKAKSWLLDKLKQADKPLVRLIMKNREKYKFNNLDEAGKLFEEYNLPKWKQPEHLYVY